ncbi:MAG: cation transporter [Chloroflexota bacterium]|jgi:copper ion binding protein
MTTVTYTVPAISCGHCTHTIESEVGELQGVQSVKAEVDSKKVEITFDAPANEAVIKALLSEINYPAEGLITL